MTAPPATPDPRAAALHPQPVPRATYRLQLHPQWTLHDAAALLGYLDGLGVSTVYLSPILTPRTGSTHGYDIVDHRQINPAIGGADGFAALAAEARAHGMDIILDVVPNHMGIGDSANVWWMDVLENGPSSVYADYFDIDWHPLRPELGDKVLLPILGDQYGDVLERGELRLAYADGTFVVTYYDHRLPVAPRTYRHILEPAVELLAAALGASHPHVQELQSIHTALGYLPPRDHLPPDQRAERHREKAIIKRRLAALVQESPPLAAALEDTLARFNGTLGVPSSFDPLDALLAAQPYRLAYWRVAAEEINYRRFFDINELAAIRVEDPAVFAATHQLIFQLLAAGDVAGLRVDHPDGLLDPAGYFAQLQAHAAACRAACGLADAPLYVVAEKILAQGEALRQDWAIAGTTGYDFLNDVTGMWVDGRHAAAFDAIYAGFTGAAHDFATLVNSSKKLIMLVALASEVAELSLQLERLAEGNRRYRDFTLSSLTFALREVLAALPVYRTYLAGPGTATPHDQAAITAAVAEARRRNPRTAAAIFDFLEDTLLLRNLDRFSDADAARLVAFVGKVQQVSGPVMAKGVEDTAFYRYHRLVALNEVGGHPEQFGGDAATFHQHNQQRLARWPHTLLATATHDTKRGEDVRARLCVLSELPDQWRAALDAWSAQAQISRTMLGGQPMPDRNDEYLLYQTLVGTWSPAWLDGAPEDRSDPDWADYGARINAYMLKAVREAKQHTSWVNPNAAYEAALRRLVTAVLAAPLPPVVRELLRLVMASGQVNTLAQTLLKLTAPGVPDLYQGSEMLDLSLVDPDNRRPVDYARRRAALAALRQATAAAHGDRAGLAASLLAGPPDGRAKLWVIAQTLAFRRDCPDLFAQGNYAPLDAQGPRAGHVVAFARAHGGTTALVVVPRLVAGLTGGTGRAPVGAETWGDTWLALPAAERGVSYRSVLTGAALVAQPREGAAGLDLADLLHHFPVGLLVRTAQPERAGTVAGVQDPQSR